MSSWHLVAAQGFTLCVPPGGKKRGDSWRQGGTELSWGTGTPRGQATAETGKARVVRMGDLPFPLPSDVNRFDEEIGGRPATLWRNRVEQTYHVGAQWNSPAIWLTAETPDARAADLVLQIARTVRFVSK